MRVGIIGAGITGLTLTHELAARDVDVVTFEAATEPGGVIRSTEHEGRILEHGPQRLRITPSIQTLVGQLSLDGEVVTADPELPLYVYHRGELRTVPRSFRGFLGTNALSWRGKARVLLEPTTAPITPTERAGDAFIRKFGHEAYHSIIEPLFGGMYGSDPMSMPAEHALERVMKVETTHGSLLRAAVHRLRDRDSTPPPASFRAGLQLLPQALYDKHAPYVHLDTPVSRIAPADSGNRRWVIVADGRKVPVDHAVMTVPAHSAGQILAAIPELDVEPLMSLRYNSLVIVHLEADLDHEGFGYQIARDEEFETLGVSWNESLFGRENTYTAFLGGMWDPTTIERDPATLGAVAAREFEAITGAPATVVGVRKLPKIIPAMDESWAALSRLSLPDGISLATNYMGPIGIPSRVREAKSVARELADDEP